LEIHKPKAAHSLRDFAIELLTIVAGILIAIALEQTVEAHHWHEKVRAARESLRDELRMTDDFYQFRVAANECVARRLSQLNEIVESLAEHREEPLVGDLTLHLGQLLGDDAWQSEKAAQTAAHLPPGELQQYSLIYAQQSDIRGWENQEESAWAAIRILQGNPNRLSPSDLTVIRQNIQVARSLNFLVVVNSVDQLERSSKLGVTKAAMDAARARAACAPLKREAPSIPYTTF